MQYITDLAAPLQQLQAITLAPTDPTNPDAIAVPLWQKAIEEGDQAVIRVVSDVTPAQAAVHQVPLQARGVRIRARLDAMDEVIAEVMQDAVQLEDRVEVLEDRVNNIPAGPKGDQGTQGIAGKDGKDGAAGSQGPQGVQGVAGPKGDTVTGPAGPQGPAGADLTNPRIRTKRVTTVAMLAGEVKTATVLWDVPFADAAYTVVVSVIGPQTLNLTANIVSFTKEGVVVSAKNALLTSLAANAASLHLLAIHD